MPRPVEKLDSAATAQLTNTDGSPSGAHSHDPPSRFVESHPCRVRFNLTSSETRLRATLESARCGRRHQPLRAAATVARNMAASAPGSCPRLTGACSPHPPTPTHPRDIRASGDRTSIQSTAGGRGWTRVSNTAATMTGQPDRHQLMASPLGEGPLEPVRALR